VGTRGRGPGRPGGPVGPPPTKSSGRTIVVSPQGWVTEAAAFVSTIVDIPVPARASDVRPLLVLTGLRAAASAMTMTRGG
jgi:hypothetical protein